MAVALAAEAAATGKRVLAVDASASADLEPLVAASGLKGRFETLRLTTRSALDEYLKLYLKLPLGPSRLGPLATIFDYVSAAAPGVREILMIGKIGWEARSGPWDEIIVDGPATGHVVEMINAPASMAELVPTGPLAQQTGWLREVLAAPTTDVVLVTIPEELPVSETGELLARLRTETSTAVKVLVANRTPVAIDDGGLEEVARRQAQDYPGAAVLQLAAARSQLSAVQNQRLEELALTTITAGEDRNRPVDAVRKALQGLIGPGSAR